MTVIAAPQTVRYAVARTNARYPMGTPFHLGCLRESWHRTAYMRRTFSIGEIDPADLAGERCGYCHDDWQTGPKHMQPAPTRRLHRPGDEIEPLVMSMKDVIAVGFGMAIVTRDGETLLDGEDAYHNKDNGLRVSDAEALAADDPDHDWRIEMHGPMGGSIYQRHGIKQWVYVKRVPGFID